MARRKKILREENIDLDKIVKKHDWDSVLKLAKASPSRGIVILLDLYRRVYEDSDLESEYYSTVDDYLDEARPETAVRFLSLLWKLGAYKDFYYWDMLARLVSRHPKLSDSVFPLLVRGYEMGIHRKPELGFAYGHTLAATLSQKPELAKMIDPKVFQEILSNEKDVKNNPFFWLMFSDFISVGKDGLKRLPLDLLLLPVRSKAFHDEYKDAYSEYLLDLISERSEEEARKVLEEVYRLGREHSFDFWKDYHFWRDIKHSKASRGRDVGHLLPTDMVVEGIKTVAFDSRKEDYLKNDYFRTFFAPIIYRIFRKDPQKAVDILAKLFKSGAHSIESYRGIARTIAEERPTVGKDLLDRIWEDFWREHYKSGSAWQFVSEVATARPSLLKFGKKIIIEGHKRGATEIPAYFGAVKGVLDADPTLARHPKILDFFIDGHRKGAHRHPELWAALASAIRHNPDLAKDPNIVRLFLSGYRDGAHKHNTFWWALGWAISRNPSLVRTFRGRIPFKHPELFDVLGRAIRDDPSLSRHPEVLDLLIDGYRDGAHQHSAFFRAVASAIKGNPDFIRRLRNEGILRDVLKGVYNSVFGRDLPEVNPFVWDAKYDSDRSLKSHRRHFGPLRELTSLYHYSGPEDVAHLVPYFLFALESNRYYGDSRGDRTDAFPLLVESLLKNNKLSKQHALLLALALHDIDKRFPGIHIERELPARQAIISKILAPHNATTSEIMDHPILRKLARLYGHYLGTDLHDLTVALRDAVIHAQVHQVMDTMDRDYFHNHTPTTPEEAKEYINKAKTIYEKTNDPSAYLTYVLSRVFDKNISRDALAHIVALNASLRKGGFEREAHEIIHNHKDIVENALKGDKNALQQLKSLVHLARLRELLIDKDPQLFRELGLHEKENITLSKWKEILERAKRDERLKEYISTVTSLPISGVSLDASSKWNLDKLVRMRRFEKENVGAYEALLHAIQTGRVADEHIQKLKELPTHKLMDSVLKILYADGAIDEKKYRKIVQKLRSTPAKDLPKTFEKVDHEIRDILQAHYYTPFTLFGNIHETPRTPVETFVERALDELHERISAHNATLALQMTRPKARENLWKDIHKLNKIPPDVEHPLQLVRELPATKRSEPVAVKAFEKK